MKCKLNIIEPWESGTETAIEADIVKEKQGLFLLYTKNNIKVRGEIAHYFICKFRNEEDRNAFKKRENKNYVINMVFDKNLSRETEDLPDFELYRANFLTGELLI